MYTKKRNIDTVQVAVEGALRKAARAQEQGRGIEKSLDKSLEKLLETQKSRTARRLERIEKEMGYCEVKLEKERRLRKQIEYLKENLDGLDRLINKYTGYGKVRVPHQAPHHSGRADLDTGHRLSRDSFLAAGLMEILEEEREILGRELEEIHRRLLSFSDFESKRTVLEEEKRSAFKELEPNHSAKMRRIDDDFKKIERQWNFLTEDLLNLDEAIFFLDRNLDYLKSCRGFLVSAKGGFDIESWIHGGYLADLFRHSTIGRAKEMADGADRNLKMALKELVCLSNLKVRADQFLKILHPLLDSLYEDIFVEVRIENSLTLVESVLADNQKAVDALKVRREQLNAKVEEIEKIRAQVFTKLDADRASDGDDDDDGEA